MTPAPGPGERVAEKVERHRKYLASVQWKDAVYYSAMEILDAYDLTTTALREARAAEGEWKRLYHSSLDTIMAQAAAKDNALVKAEEKLRDAERAQAKMQETIDVLKPGATNYNRERLRAEHAEQRVAGLEAAARKIRKCNVAYVYESDNRLMRDFIGIARTHFDELMALLTPPPGGRR